MQSLSGAIYDVWFLCARNYRKHIFEVLACLACLSLVLGHVLGVGPTQVPLGTASSSSLCELFGLQDLLLSFAGPSWNGQLAGIWQKKRKKVATKCYDQSEPSQPHHPSRSKCLSTSCPGLRHNLIVHLMYDVLRAMKKPSHTLTNFDWDWSWILRVSS